MALMIKRRCRSLRRGGLSIGQIARIVSRSESTVHWHVRGLKLSKIQEERLRHQKRTLMAKVNAKRRGVPIRPVEFRRPGWSSALVHLVSHLSFDGRVDHHGCHYYSRQREQALHVQQLLRRLLAVAARVRRKSNEMWVVSFYSVQVAKWLSERERELLSVVSRRPAWRIGWLKALFDDEGHVHYSTSTRRVRASQDDPQILRVARRWLSQVGINSRIDQGARAVEITGRDNLSVFHHRIGFSRGLTINEHRKNGLWAHPFEKRELLELALASYQDEQYAL